MGQDRNDFLTWVSDGARNATEQAYIVTDEGMQFHPAQNDQTVSTGFKVADQVFDGIQIRELGWSDEEPEVCAIPVLGHDRSHQRAETPGGDPWTWIRRIDVSAPGQHVAP
jgi:hypothetical protein